MSDSASVSIHIDAAPEKVYELVSDLPRMGQWSPECQRCEWVGGASAASVGARFKGHNRIGWRRWSTKGEVVVADPGRELAWDVTSVFGLPVARWRYVMHPKTEGGTEVVESTEDKRGRIMHVLGWLATGVTDREGHNTEGMRATLQRIKAEAERSGAEGAPARSD
jgi:uncharacterized protein YndB with AHSA1/START domain